MSTKFVPGNWSPFPLIIPWETMNLFGGVVDTLGYILGTLVSVLDTLIASASVLSTLGIVLYTLGSAFNELVESLDSSKNAAHMVLNHLPAHAVSQT